MVISNYYHFFRGVERNGYQSYYLFSLYKFYFYIWKNFYSSFKKDFETNSKFYSWWSRNLSDQYNWSDLCISYRA